MALLPDAQAFLEAWNTVEVETTAANSSASDEHPLDYSADRDVFQGQILARTAAFEQIEARESNGHRKAVATLAQSEVPVLAWLARNVFVEGGEYWNEGMQALQSLTVGGDHLAELDRASDRYEWCNVYRNMRRRMLNESAFVGTHGPAWSKVAEALRGRGWSEENIATSLANLVREFNEGVRTPLS